MKSLLRIPADLSCLWSPVQDTLFYLCDDFTLSQAVAGATFAPISTNMIVL